MKKLKKLISGAALIGLSVVTSEAQSALYAGALNGGTNQVPALATNSFANVTILRARWVTFQPECAMLNGASTSTSNVVFSVQNSTENNIWNTYSNYVVTPNGTNVTGPCFPIDTGGSVFWRVQIQNTNNVVLTNVALPFGKRDGL